MSQQTSYSLYHGRAVTGMLFGNSPKDISTGAVEDAAGIKVGLAVTYGTGDNQVKLLTGGSDAILGATILSQEYEINYADLGTGDFTVAQNDMVSVLREGYIYLTCEEAVAKGETVFARHTAGTGSVIGAVRNDADTASCTDTGWTFEETTSGAGLALVRVK